MATYAQNARKRELAAQRAAQDAALRDLHRGFDLSAQDNHMKYERPSFAVVTATDAFRKGYDNIDWQMDHERADQHRSIGEHSGGGRPGRDDQQQEREGSS